MHRIETTQFGPLDYVDSDVYRFPSGLPGFEDHQHFLLVERPAFSPIVFLQSIDQGSLRFACAPVHVVEPHYSVVLSETETGLLEPGSPLLILGILMFSDSRPPTVNLLAPVVLNLETRVGVQSIQYDSGYSAEHLLRERAPVEATCS